MQCAGFESGPAEWETDAVITIAISKDYWDEKCAICNMYTVYAEDI